MIPPLASDPLFAALNGLTALVLLWNIFLAGQIAQLREAPRVFAGISAIIGLLAAPALFLEIVGASILTGRSVVGVQWVWPVICVLFVVQAAYATLRRLVTPLLGGPILVYDTLVAAAAIVRFGEQHGWGLPTAASALPAAEAAVLGISLGSAALASPLALALPILSPAYPARWRVSRFVRIALALFAASASALIGLELVRGVRAVTSYAEYDGEPLRERAPSDFAIGLRLFPTLDDAPPPLALRQDLALVDSVGVQTLMVVLTPEGTRIGALDSLARSLELRRSDSTVLVVALGYGRDDREERRRDVRAYEAGRLAAVDRIVRRLRPDLLLPADDPYGRGTRAVGRLAPRDWARMIGVAAARARRLRPRTRVGVAASTFEPADSALFTWAAAPGSPVDVVGFSLRPSFGGAVSLDARLRAADRLLRRTGTTKPVWVFAAGGYPYAHGERSQARAIWGTLVWATTHERVKGIIVADAGDYDGRTGLRAPGGRVRPAAAMLTRALRSLQENAGQ